MNGRAKKVSGQLGGPAAPSLLRQARAAEAAMYPAAVCALAAVQQAWMNGGWHGELEVAPAALRPVGRLGAGRGTLSPQEGQHWIESFVSCRGRNACRDRAEGTIQPLHPPPHTQERLDSALEKALERGQGVAAFCAQFEREIAMAQSSMEGAIYACAGAPPSSGLGKMRVADQSAELQASDWILEAGDASWNWYPFSCYAEASLGYVEAMAGADGSALQENVPSHFQLGLCALAAGGRVLAKYRHAPTGQPEVVGAFWKVMWKEGHGAIQDGVSWPPADLTVGTRGAARFNMRARPHPLSLRVRRPALQGH